MLMVSVAVPGSSLAIHMAAVLISSAAVGPYVWSSERRAEDRQYGCDDYSFHDFSSLANYKTTLN